ncbi:protein mono-ADP-ribosyltransferase PARP14-like isoform X2 [Saccostrea echinata]|uniref:protein mono-ADP-ribosyltransferase PARP14-like isoform X2 n=1 Tax=Saccostrea echinata TaxID=191078 RepID=UPI002A828509|nr:protein mono-ADP-ribosyltransferase PARP14-like isoform X2 [Saccostrea echinata]
MSGGFIMNRLREELSSRCVIVGGFPPPPAILPQNVYSLFQCQRAEPAGEGTSWLVLFQNSDQAKWWVTNRSTYHVGNMSLRVTPSCGSNIPDAWLQDDQHGSAGAQMPGYPTGFPGFQGYPGYPSHGIPVSMPSTSQRDQIHTNPYNQHIPVSSPPFQYPSGGPTISNPGGLPHKIPPGSEPQVITSDPMSSKASMAPTVYQNYPSMSMPEPGAMAPPSYESHNFPPKLPPKPSTMKSPKLVQVDNSKQEQSSIHQGSDIDPGMAPVQETPPPACDSIQVSRLPRDITEEFISDFFENEKRSGGGYVANVDYDEKKNTAIVKFEDPSVVKSVLQRQESSAIVMNKQQIEIEEYNPAVDSEVKGESDDLEVTAVKVTNLPPKATDEQIELFFENPRKSGGGEVEKVEFDEATKSAIVWFKDPEVVASVLQKHESTSLMINKQQIEVEEYRPPRNDNDNSSEEEDQEGGAIKVTKLPPGTSEEQISLFFENRRKSGGGDVEKVEYDEDSNSAVVWFKDVDVVSSVLQKAPLLFNKKQIGVEQVRMDGKKVEKEAEENTGPLCTIEVRGMKETTSIDSVELYFDNKRKSGGGGVDEVKGEVEDGVLYVTFEDEDTVERVLQRGHKVDGATLQVKLYQPPKPVPMYQDRVLIKGFNPETSKDGLINFLEAKSGEDVKDVVYGQEEGTAMVTFEELKDFGKLEAACQKKALEKCYLAVKRIPISNCVIVSGFGESTSVDTLEFYFDNEKRSGGGGVKEAKVNPEDGTCLVYFEDPAVCDRVCHKSHRVDNQKLTVHTYHECLGQPFNPDEGPKFKPLDPVIVRELDMRKMKFIYTSEEFKQAMNKQAELTHGKIRWPKKAATELTVECTLTKDVKDCRKLAEKWEKQVADGIKKLLGVLHVEAVNVLQEAWEKFLEGIKQVKVPDPQKVGIILEKGNYTIAIVGYGNMVEGVRKEVEKIITTVVDEIQRKKQQVTETVQLKHHQFLLLSFDHFKEETEKKFPDMQVKTNMKDKSFTFEGQYLEVSQAKISLFEKCQQIYQASAGKFSKNRRDFLNRKDVKSRIAKLLKEKENMSCFDFQREEVMLYAFSDDKAVEAAHLIKDSIVESPIDVQPDSAFLLNSDAWDKKVKEIAANENFEGLLQLITLHEPKQVIIVTMNEYVGLAREFVEDFLRDNTIMSDSMDVPPSYFRFLELHHKNKFEQLCESLKEQQVQITKSKNRITIKGTKMGLDQAKGNIEDMLKKIQSKKHTIKRPGIAKHLHSEAGKNKISKVQKFHKCYIQIGDKEPMGFSSSWTTASGPRQKQASNGDIAEHKTKAGVSIKVHSGDLTALPVDVIVNAANPDLIHHGGLAGVIAKKGGNEIQEECSEYVRRNGKLKEGDTFCSRAGQLSCKMIVHACGPTWKGGMNQENGHLTNCVESALEETENMSHRSIAIPALCTGIFGYPIDKATSVIVKAVKSHLKDKKGSSIKEVILCDVKPETVKCFTEALKQEYKGKVTVFKNTDESGSPRSLQTEAQGQTPAQNTEFTAGHISVKLIKGQIAKSKVDVIVNTASRDLRLNHGAVSGSISKAGGDSIQQECLTKYPDGINPGEIAVTGGGNLACKIVCHGALLAWDKEKGEAKKMLQTFLKTCLTEAQKQNMSSIAFPAMGTGNLCYPKDVVAAEMCNSVVNFSKDNPKSCVKAVEFVIYEKDFPTIQAFETEMNKRATKDKKSKPKKKGKRHGDELKLKEEDGFVVVPEAGVGGQKEVSVDIGPIKLRMYQGDITLADVDVIVNGTDSEMDLNKGAVSRKIKSKLGGELQRQIEIQKKNMKKHGLAVTVNADKSKLPAKFIIHADVTGGNYKKKILDVLHKVEEIGQKSVALPALGTGQGYQQQTIEEFAEEVFGGLNKICTDVKNLSEVHIIIYEQQMTQKFIIAMQNCFESKGATPKGWMEKFKNYAGLGGGGKPDGGRHWRPVFGDKPDDQSSIVIVIFADDEKNIDAAVKKLENLLDEDFNTKEFNDPIICQISKAQVNSLQNLESRFDVDVQVDQVKGIVTVHGTKDALMEATDYVHNLLRDADRNKQAVMEAELVSDIVQWYFVDNGDGKNELCDYPKNINLLVEKAYRNKQPDVKFTDQAGTEYTINFNNMEEFPSDDPKDVTTVTRRDKIKDSTFEPPPEWTAMKEENLVVVQVKSGTPEYSSVIDRFHGQVGKRNIVKLERIQNKMLYQQYVAKKKLLDTQNSSSTQNERELWHGTAPDAVNSINSLGFNRSYCGRNATAYGEGVYFAVNAGYSASNTYSKPDPSGHKRMYLCKVLTGEYTGGRGGMRVPPTKAGQQSHILYDSVVDNVNNPSMFIIFNDTQGYPCYLITFT